MKPPRYRAIDIKINYDKDWRFNIHYLWNVLWGSDIFINDVPFLRCVLLLNFLVWLSLIL